VVLVDMQDFFLNNFSPAMRSSLISEQGKIVDLCMRKNIPLVVLEYKASGKDRGKTTPKLEQKIRKIKQEVIIKENNSGFTKTHLDSILKALKVREVIVMGVNANGCVQDTAIGAQKRGYKVATCLETMASASNKDGQLSRKNKEWFRKNTALFASTKELMNYLVK